LVVEMLANLGVGVMFFLGRLVEPRGSPNRR
jgi:hypothetical protein